jgi:hypothetical protein
MVDRVQFSEEMAHPVRSSVHVEKSSDDVNETFRRAEATERTTNTVSAIPSAGCQNRPDDHDIIHTH